MQSSTAMVVNPNSFFLEMSFYTPLAELHAVHHESEKLKNYWY